MRVQYFTTKVIAGATALMLITGGCGDKPGEAEMNRALQEMARGDHVRAKASFEASLARRPDARVYNLIGVLAFKLGQTEKAIEAFENSRRLDGTLPAPDYNLGVLMYRGGQFSQAKKFFNSAAALGQDPEPYEYLSELATRENQWDEAYRFMRLALARAPGSPRVLTGMAALAIRRGDSDAALVYLTQALERDPAYAPGLYNMAVVYDKMLNDKTRAQEYYARHHQAAKTPKRLPDNLSVLPPSGQAQDAQPASVLIPPIPAPTNQRIPSTSTPAPAATPTPQIFDLAARHAAEGKPEEALKLFLNEARAAEARKDKVRCEQALRAALEHIPGHPQTHVAWGQWMRTQGRLEESLASFKRAVALDPSSVAGQMGVAEISVLLGDMDTALVLLRQVCQKNPEYADAHWMIADVYDRQLNNIERAIDSYTHFEKAFPRDGRAATARERIKKLSTATAISTQNKPATILNPTAQPPPAPTPPQMIATTTKTSAAPASSTTEEADPLKDAEHAFQRLGIKPMHILNTRAAGQALSRGISYHQRKDWERALYYYQRAIENDDSRSDAFRNLGVVYIAKTDYEMARDALLCAMKCNPESPDTRYHLAYVYNKLHARNTAINQLRIALKIDPTYAKTHLLLGQLYAERPETLEDSKRHYRRYLELVPDDPDADKIRAFIAGKSS